MSATGFDTRGLNAEGGIFETSGISRNGNAGSDTRGISRLLKLIPVVSPQPISFSFSGRTLSGLNSHCGVRSAFSFSRSRFLFPCGGVV